MKKRIRIVLENQESKMSKVSFRKNKMITGELIKNYPKFSIEKRVKKISLK